MSDPIKLNTRQFRLAFATLIEPKSIAGGKPRFTATAVFPDEDQIEDIRKACSDILTQEFGADQAKWPMSKIRLPYERKANKVDKKGQLYQGFEGSGYALSMSSYNPVPCIDLKKAAIDPKELYSGCYARAAITLKYYGQPQMGIACYMNGLQKTYDGPALGGGAVEFDDDIVAPPQGALTTASNDEPPFEL